MLKQMVNTSTYLLMRCKVLSGPLKEFCPNLCFWWAVLEEEACTMFVLRTHIHLFQDQAGFLYSLAWFLDFSMNLGWRVSNTAGRHFSHGCSLSTQTDSPMSSPVSQPATHSSWVGEVGESGPAKHWLYYVRNHVVILLQTARLTFTSLFCLL